MGTNDSPEFVAFDPRASQDEVVSALSHLQQVYAPTAALSDETIQGIFDVADLTKSRVDFSGNVVPFPKKRGMTSVRLDDFQLNLQGEYFERPSALSFDSLRSMVGQTPILSAIVLTRIRQISRFCGVSEDGRGLGFSVQHIDKEHSITPDEAESIRLLNRFFLNCGWEFNPRRRKRLKRDSFAQFMSKLVRDSLVLDSAPIETEFKRDRAMGLDGLYAVDGATIRLCTEHGYRGDDEIFAVQVVQGRIESAYSYEELIYEPRNPRSDVLVAGYGMSETELLVRIVTGFLNAMSLNISGFDSNSIPKGMLHLTGNYSNSDLQAFKRIWNAQVRGVNNSWVLPVMVSKDQESKASFESFGNEFNEMYFAKWMTFLTSIACAVYGISPSEINFDSFTGGNTSALSGSDTEEKLADSKDKGLRPTLSYFENMFSDFVTSEFSDKYVFRWTGLDEVDVKTREERSRLVCTVNEIRAQEGFDKMEGPLGDAPVNPSLIGVWQQLQQAAQPQDFGQPPGPPGEPPQDDQGAAPQQQAQGDDQDQGDQEDQGADFGREEEGLDFGKALPMIYSIEA